MTLTKHYLTGKQYLATVTDLLQRIRLEDPYAGLVEAADLQWWWCKDDTSHPDRQIFWFNNLGNAVACLLRRDAGDEWNNDLMVLPSAKQQIEQWVIPEVIAQSSHADKTSTMSVRDDDIDLQRVLVDAGFVKSGVRMILTELVKDPARTELAPGFTLQSRVEEGQLPHHLIRRNGSDIAFKLRECSLYRPELDLCIREVSGTVAAYVLFWMDDVTKVGLIEPVRTEAQFPRMGFASHLIAEGIARLRDLGAESIRVATGADNEAAKSLYHRLGFEDRFKELEYRRTPSP